MLTMKNMYESNRERERERGGEGAFQGRSVIVLGLPVVAYGFIGDTDAGLMMDVFIQEIVIVLLFSNQ